MFTDTVKMEIRVNSEDVEQCALEFSDSDCSDMHFNRRGLEAQKQRNHVGRGYCSFMGNAKS